ncbi:Hypothetical predicted protein [Olea europaea subsp. europaea]|uniref:Uncharacterized protein n=1 Tax=Olea europaea subsp. europaea TaxID=158383 RepID=A0A8S0RUF0_OLEEU|nr:Hypothetical predicted protein [Olea europaea subsp. europaea]
MWRFFTIAQDGDPRRLLQDVSGNKLFNLHLDCVIDPPHDVIASPRFEISVSVKWVDDDGDVGYSKMMVMLVTAKWVDDDGVVGSDCDFCAGVMVMMSIMTYFVMSFLVMR